MKTPGLTNKYLKEQHEIMLAFGYELHWKKGKRGGHPIYSRDGFEDLELSSTPRNQKSARKRLRSELQKRHPDHSYWRSRKKVSRKKVNRRRPPALTLATHGAEASPRLILVARERPPVRAPRTVVRPSGKPACNGCGRPWVSDLDYSFRPCPKCGGTISLERAA